MNRLALAIALFSSVALLSGCIIVPHRHGGHRGHGNYYQGATHHQGASTVYVQPGPRR